MSRFEIQDLLNNYEWGVTYHAYDKLQLCDVTLRRGHPLNRDEAITDTLIREYEQSCIRLSRLSHPNLRTVIQGSVDPVDRTPYIVNEWIKGTPLSQWLADAKLPQETAKELAISALRASLALSDTIGQEAVWIDTHPDSIMVGEAGSPRHFTFWVSISAWFGSPMEDRRVSTIANLVEPLVDWNHAALTNNSSNKLAHWIQWVKKTPGISVREALSHLEEPTSKTSTSSREGRPKNWAVTAPPTPGAAPARITTHAPAVPPKVKTSLAPTYIAPHRSAKTAALLQTQPKSSSPIKIIMITTACILCIAGLAFLIVDSRKKAFQPVSNTTQQQSSQTIPDNPLPTTTADQPKPNTSEPIIETPVTLPSKPIPKTSPATPKTKTFSPNQIIPIDQITMANRPQKGTFIKVRGTLIETSEVKKHQRIFLTFKSPDDTPCIPAFAVMVDSPNAVTMEKLEAFKNKEIILDCYFSIDRKIGAVVSIKSMSQIQLAEQAD